MAVVELKYRSDILKNAVQMSVVIPQRALDAATSAAEKSWPLLLLLHGLGEDHSHWIRNTPIERLAEEAGIAVVMPSLERSFGLNMESGPRWFDHLSEEVPAIARQTFRLSFDPASTFAGGVSMGGYCAFHLALAQPDRYAAAFSLSGALDFAAFLKMEDLEIQSEFARIASDADAFEKGDAHLPNLLTRAAAAGTVPQLYQFCGRDDFLYGMNTDFRDFAGKSGVRITWRESEGEHDWNLWDGEMRRAMIWLGSRVQC